MAAQARRALPRLEAVCLWLTGACLIAMVVLILVEVVTRAFFNFSFEVVDEVGGYLTVAVSFLALAPAQARKAYHNVSLVHDRLSPVARRACQMVFLALSFGFAAAVLGAMVRYVYRSWKQGDVTSTVLQTPLWIPQSVMVLGMFALCWVLVVELAALIRTPALQDSADAS